MIQQHFEPQWFNWNRIAVICKLRIWDSFLKFRREESVSLVSQYKEDSSLVHWRWLYIYIYVHIYEYIIHVKYYQFPLFVTKHWESTAGRFLRYSNCKCNIVSTLNLPEALYTQQAKARINDKGLSNFMDQ